MQMSIQINITGEVVTEEKEGSFHGACLPVQLRTREPHRGQGSELRLPAQRYRQRS